MPHRALQTLPLLATLALAGCFSEGSFPMNPRRLVAIDPPTPRTTDHWARIAHTHAAKRLPLWSQDALTSPGLRQPTSVAGALNTADLHHDHLLANYAGLMHSAQVVSDGIPSITPANWPNTTAVDVPTHDGLTLRAYLRKPAKDTLNRSYIVITHGLFGTLDGIDCDHQVNALTQAGHHVLALEMRAHGNNRKAHPNTPMTFGIHEAQDLLAASRYLRNTHNARRVGLLAFSITAHEGLLAACLDSNTPPSPAPPLLPSVPPRSTTPAFDAGMFLVSPPLNLTAITQNLDQPRNLLTGPCRWMFQQRTRQRFADLGLPPSHRISDFARHQLTQAYIAAGTTPSEQVLRHYLNLIDFSSPLAQNTTSTITQGPATPRQIATTRPAAQDPQPTSHSPLAPVPLAYVPSNTADAPPFQMPTSDDQPPAPAPLTATPTLEGIRQPVLILSSANDPLDTAQSVANLLARTDNPNLGGIILRGGGHMGFTALAPDYYYSLLLAFFDPQTAPETSRP